MLLLVNILSINVLLASGYLNGNIPLTVCESMTPNHDQSPQAAETNPYEIVTQFRTYIPGRRMRVNLQSSGPGVQFAGFYVQSRSPGIIQPIGKFSPNSNLFTTHNCPSTVTDSRNTISHSQVWSSNPKSVANLNWTPPEETEAHIFIQGTFVQSFSTFWTEKRSMLMQSISTLNISECCSLEELKTAHGPSVCLSIDQGGAIDTNYLLSIVIPRNDSIFSLFRCWFWSSSSSPCRRSSLQDCCESKNVTDKCKELCYAEEFVNFNVTVDHELQQCIIEDPNFLTCLARKGCSDNQVCKSSDHSEACICNDGFSNSGNETCTDVDECLTGNVCSPYSVCNNTFGSYVCTCNEGFAGDGIMCLDVNECAAGIDDCSDDAICHNLNGSFYCECKTGFSGFGNNCLDINECFEEFIPCPSNSNCHNLHGSFECSCIAGYIKNESLCTDVNECAAESNDCSDDAICHNLNGSFYCECKTGFSGFGYNCSDVDECSENPSVCPTYLVCSNTLGSFVCTCQPGYTLVGAICTEITYPPNAIGFNIVSTILINVTSQLQETNLINQLEIQLLIPALASLPGYHSVIFLQAVRGSLIVTTEGVFVLNNENPELPSLLEIKENINNRAQVINYSLSSPDAVLDPNFPVSRTVRNGLCRNDSCSRNVPISYHVACVSLGTSEAICVCIHNFTQVETLCNNITSTTTESSTVSTTIPITTEIINDNNPLSPGAIAGIVIGCLFAAITVAVVVFFCFKNRSKKLENPDTQSYYSSSYVNPDCTHSQQVNDDPIYMEIKPQSKATLSSNDGEYIDISDAYYDSGGNANELTAAPRSNLSNTDGYELAEEPRKNEDTKELKPVKPPVSRMDSAGYLTPTRSDEHETPNEYDVYHRS